ncbi:MAG: hypothetical protein K6G55_04640 [Selenomonadaceae bacterium]|nr:hypothetical protein [Selenomonadaceae bacterium]
MNKSCAAATVVSKFADIKMLTEFITVILRSVYIIGDWFIEGKIIGYTSCDSAAKSSSRFLSK